MTRATRLKEETHLRPDWEHAAARGPWSYDPKTQHVIYLSAVTVDLSAPWPIASLACNHATHKSVYNMAWLHRFVMILC